jgi:hypothetical protein
MQPSSSQVASTADSHTRSTLGDVDMQPPTPSMAEQHERMMRRRLDAGKRAEHVQDLTKADLQWRKPDTPRSEGQPTLQAAGHNEATMDVSTTNASVSVEGEHGMDIDWLTVEATPLPLRITRSNAACTDTVDFTEGMWDFSKIEHREAATKVIEDNKPGLIIGEELQQSNTSRNDALANFHSKIQHAEYLSTLYTQQANRGLYYLHVALSDSKSSAVGISKMTDLEICPRHRYVKLNNLSIATNSDAVAQSYIAQDKEYTSALVDETSERRKHRARWSDDEDAMEAMFELNQCDDDNDDYYETIAWDDVKDVALDLSKVRKARATEMTYVKKRNVYKYASIAYAKS